MAASDSSTHRATPPDYDPVALRVADLSPGQRPPGHDLVVVIQSQRWMSGDWRFPTKVSPTMSAALENWTVSAVKSEHSTIGV